MGKKKIIGNANDYYQFLVDELNLVTVNSSHEHIYRVSEKYGQGYLNRICLREGIEICITDLLLKKRIRIYYRMGKSPFEVCYCLSGYIYHHENDLGHIAYFGKGQMGVYLKENVEGWVEYPEGVKCKFVSVYAYPSFIKSFSSYQDIGYESNNLDVSNEKIHHLMSPQQIKPVLMLPFNQIENCTFEGLTRLIYLESRAMEVLSLTLEMEILSERQSNNYLHLKSSDRDSINQAKELMAENMVDPLTINQLAKKVGINTFKLKNGFKQLYGTTIFGYLRDIRLARARVLLEDKELNISEIANAVGYSNPSHFSVAFRKKYGCNPSELRWI